MLHLEAGIVLGTGIVIGVAIAAVTLMTFAFAVRGLPLPTISPVACATVLLAVAGSGAAAIVVPARLMLRRRTS